MALDRNRPIELLATPAGKEMVKDLLGTCSKAFIREAIARFFRPGELVGLTGR